MKNKSNPPRNQALTQLPEEILRKRKKRYDEKIPLLSCGQVATLNKDNLVSAFNDPSDEYAIKGKLRRLTPGSRWLYSYLLEKGLDGAGVGWDTQGYLAKVVFGVTRQTVCGWFGELTRAGLLNSIEGYNGTNGPKTYAPPECLRKETPIKKVLSKFIPALKLCLIITTLLACPQELSQKGTHSLIGNPTHYLKSPLYIYKNSSVSSVSYTSYIHEGVISERNVQRGRRSTPEVRRLETREKMKRRADDNVSALLESDSLTREERKQIEKMLENRRY